MKIQNVTIRKANLQLLRPYTIAFKTVNDAENGIIEITSSTGLVGYGAFNPSYEVIREKLDDGLNALAPQHVEWLIGKEVTDIYALCNELQERFSNSITARTGMEIALFDLFAQSKGVPLVQLLGQQIHSMPTSITIGIKNVQETIEEAREYTGRQFKILKIKLGISPEEDLERLIKLREVFGNSIQLIVDANQGYNYEQLVQFSNRIANLGIQLVEQPLPVGREQEMRQLPDNIKQVLAADESLKSPADALSLATAPAACGFFNIKLMKCGGITQALKIAATAKENNIGLMWGCNDESIISITAALHAAFACGHTKFIDLDGSLDLAQDVVAGGFILENGIMSISDKPGLGLDRLS